MSNAALKLWNEEDELTHPEGLRDQPAVAPEDVREYLEAHELLPAYPGEVPSGELARLANRLFRPATGREEKKSIVMLLAHHGSERARILLSRYAEIVDEELWAFTDLAAQEAREEEEPYRAMGLPPVMRNEPCLCGSGQKFKHCCGA